MLLVLRTVTKVYVLNRINNILNFFTHIISSKNANKEGFQFNKL